MSNDQSNPEQTGTSDFFESLEQEVNGSILDQPAETTPKKAAPPVVTRPKNQGTQNTRVDWQKRYKDSSREATKIREELNELTPFVPLLNAMKQDSGLVNHVRGYLQNGGTPSKNVKEELGLGDDFMYDHDEALSNPDSNSAKVFNAQVDKVVNKKVSTLMQQEKQQSAKQNAALARQRETAAFMRKHKMNQSDFNAMMEKAKTRQMSLDDIYYILNKDQNAAKVARSTRRDMMKQAKNVKSMPATTANVNSPRAEVSQEDQIFDDILGNGGADELFG
jgi:hypothetical protein